eukprot:942667-Rhodomonas_salina.2
MMWHMRHVTCDMCDVRCAMCEMPAQRCGCTIRDGTPLVYAARNAMAHARVRPDGPTAASQPDS